MNEMSKYSIGLRFGAVTAITYMILLFVKYHFFSNNPYAYSYFTLASYGIILVIFFLAGKARKKQQDGYAEPREIFQTIFIVIIFAELAYAIFNGIYLRYLNPGFLNEFRARSLVFYQKMNLPTYEIDQRLQGLQSVSDASQPRGLVTGFGTSVIMDSIFGFIFAFILRKKKPLTGVTSSDPKL